MKAAILTPTRSPDSTLLRASLVSQRDPQLIEYRSAWFIDGVARAASSLRLLARVVLFVLQELFDALLGRVHLIFQNLEILF